MAARGRSSAGGTRPVRGQYTIHRFAVRVVYSTGSVAPSNQKLTRFGNGSLSGTTFLICKTFGSRVSRVRTSTARVQQTGGLCTRSGLGPPPCQVPTNHKNLAAVGFEPTRLASTDLKSAALTKLGHAAVRTAGFEPARLTSVGLDSTAFDHSATCAFTFENTGSRTACHAQLGFGGWCGRRIRVRILV